MSIEILEATKALLLTDVVGSTELSSRIGGRAMAELWAAHDRAARDLLPRHGGREIDKTDGMLLLFDDARSAADYARAYHAALALLPVPLKARAGLHVGPVLLRENGPEDVARGAKPLEVDGLAKPTAARVMSVAGGGQTLLTVEAVRALGDAEGAAWKLRSHGHWQLKGLAEPIELVELGEPGGRFDPPAQHDKAYRVVDLGGRWIPAAEVPHNLPASRTSFVGREQELADLRRLLGEVPLVTVTGMGGLGKTRLALQAAREQMAEFPDGVWFIDLSSIADENLVDVETARVLGVADEPGLPLRQALCQWARTRRTLLILDNCEHLLDRVATLLDALLGHAPQLRVVASSRELLDIPGEQVYPILPLPAPTAGASLDDLRRAPAAQLFFERARSQRPDLAFAPEDTPRLAELVARLDGIPLAIELAAARLRSMELDEVLAGLNDRFALLTGGSRVLQRRQQTLRALIDWSFNLLSEAEQRLLARLSVFRGGFGAPDVAEVCAGAPVEPMAVPALLSQLHDKSLLMHEQRGDADRFRLLETVRAYARDTLDGSGEAAQWAARHAMHFFAVAKTVRDGLQGPEQAVHVARMETDLDDVRAAFAAAVDGVVQPQVAVKILVAMQGFWRLRGYLTEGRAAVATALALPAVKAEPMAEAWALYVGAALAIEQADHDDARRKLEACLALRRDLGRAADVAATLSALASARQQGGDLAGAIDSETEALAIFDQIEDLQGQAVGHLHLAGFKAWSGDAAAAREHLGRGLELARRLGNLEFEAECEIELGDLDEAAGDLVSAAARCARARTLCEGAGNRIGAARARALQARLDLHQGRADAAREPLRDALVAFREAESRDELLGALELGALYAGRAGRAEDALLLAGAVQELRRQWRIAARPAWASRWQEEVSRMLPAGDAAARRALDTGRAAGMAEAVKRALALLAG